VLAVLPPSVSASTDFYRLVKQIQAPALTPSTAGRPFGGVAAVGALFTMNGKRVGTHFCTGSVVHSTHGDLVMTAAHCVTNLHVAVAFVPGYANGKSPYGVWPVTGVYTDQAWQSHRSQDDDFAFLRLAGVHGGPVEHLTGAEALGTGTLGAEALGTGPRTATAVEVIGYPDGKSEPIECANLAKNVDRGTQLKFDCDNYTDGTSGGPFLVNVAARTGQGTIEGVTGGYQEGGASPNESYASAFTPATTALFRAAEAGG
jgi:V8-like Glu-specific endopeptidase